MEYWRCQRYPFFCAVIACCSQAPAPCFDCLGVLLEYLVVGVGVYAAVRGL